MMPTQKLGMPSPNMGTNRTTWSRAPSGLLAASTASGTAINTDITAANSSSQSVGPRRSRIRVATSSR